MSRKPKSHCVPLIIIGKFLGALIKTRSIHYGRQRADVQITEAIPPEDDAPRPLDEIAVYDFKPDYRTDVAFGPGSPTDINVFIVPIGCAIAGSHAELCLRRSRDHSTYERFGSAQLRHRIAMENSEAEDRKYLDRLEEAGVLLTAILEALPVVNITLV